ncbi:hypothetical protein ACJX0J_025689, partial [Zea mays]
LNLCVHMLLLNKYHFKHIIRLHFLTGSKTSAALLTLNMCHHVLHVMIVQANFHVCYIKVVPFPCNSWIKKLSLRVYAKMVTKDKGDDDEQDEEWKINLQIIMVLGPFQRLTWGLFLLVWAHGPDAFLHRFPGIVGLMQLTDKDEDTMSKAQLLAG